MLKYARDFPPAEISRLSKKGQAISSPGTHETVGKMKEEEGGREL